MRYQRVTLIRDSRLAGNDRLDAGLPGPAQQNGLDGLGIHPLPNPLLAVNGKYVGSEACQSCHEQSYKVWKKTPHTQASER